ncbi:MAG: hypothetical protein A3H50_00325 [Candidatus Levybacteria bacterium RIFCSPLOWO2_02_FULL_37_10]|nr:MAG: hypothetical protein A2860_03755 [Candidatus Levybacteria bacterium RIFCSPHIGHO2_01_FULL_37_33]OGH17545.1 MAG: hypothetical protein A3C97_01905 [Candidatus Levybacteria bacterium RIFCSPHIGHO2_02_FULL_37_11]OGH30065.1 MAG: hypothetical protein A3F30_03635 [Candidatus Levybacteria bacterium RIFCSPHIGHO2_12_FULL_37_12]OGH32359.1 MAG: hypothetical protein A2953_01795 [Candidatus Levybacteria bacterium RIFCSPLOWO2_01_FULL_36_54]OGH46319.1 MAG: hypothetical protein A3H50_00325 [Candidatus Lev
MSTETTQKYERYAPLFLRFGLALVFILFGLQKLSHPGQTTSEIQLLTNLELADSAALNFYLGLLEICTGAALLTGFKVRIFAIISFLMVTIFFLSFLSKYGMSLNPDLYRDVSLAGASIALFLLGAGPLSLDNLSHKKEGNE